MTERFSNQAVTTLSAAITTTTATSCTVTGLQDGVTYTFSVQAENGAGSAASPAPTNPATPLADAKLSAATVDDNGDAVMQVTFRTTGTIIVKLTGATAPSVKVIVE